MAYRNKTYVAFASEDLHCYRLMQAWNENDRIEFNFYNAHDLTQARDESLDESIKASLRERMKNSKQAILLGSPDARRKGQNVDSFLGYEIRYLMKLDIPIVIANLDGARTVNHDNIPPVLGKSSYFSLSVSFQAKIIQRALDSYAENYSESTNEGPHQFPTKVYEKLNL